MSGGHPVDPPQVDPAAVGRTFVVHDSHVADCGAGNEWKGLADQGANSRIFSLPADLARDNGTVAGPTRTKVDGYNGCAPGNDNDCVMFIPVASGVNDGDLHAVLWAAFLIRQTHANAHSAQLLAGYTTAGGPESFTWTWGARNSFSITSIGMTR
jgi:hypothetical protein